MYIKGFIRAHFYELFIIFLLLLVSGGYVVMMKKGKSEKTVYVRASLEKADWWSSHLKVPSLLLSNLPIPSTDSSGKATMLDLKYFFAEHPDWEKEKYSSIGSALIEIKAQFRDSQLKFDSQDLLIGNPLVITLSNYRFEFLITDIFDSEPKYDYQDILIEAKIYSVEPEYYRHIKSGMILSDNLGRKYGELVNVQLKDAVMINVDQWGNSLLRYHPRNKDVFINIRVKARKDHGVWIGYDERPIMIVGQLVLNNPVLKNIDAWITNITPNE